MKQVCLLTGKPGTGKTSLSKESVSARGGKVDGLYTEGIRSGGTRPDFRIVTLDGESALLAHVDIHSRYRVSNYGVDIDNLDQLLEELLH